MRKNFLYTITTFTIGTCAFIMGTMLSQKAAVNAQKGTETALNAEMIQIYTISNRNKIIIPCAMLWKHATAKLLLKYHAAWSQAKTGTGWSYADFTELMILTDFLTGIWCKVYLYTVQITTTLMM